VLNEERKMATRPGYRSNANTLRKLARGSMIYELGSETENSGDWDRFQIRNIGFAIARLMARKFGGDLNRMQIDSVKLLTRLLDVPGESWRGPELTALSHFAEMLTAVEDLPRWNQNEKQALVKIIRAKAAVDEGSYLKLMQKHVRLRTAMIKLGSQ